MSLKQSPLHDRHVALGAKFAEFGGWEMPLEYPTGVLKEHAAVRSAVGIFDVSHLGKLVVRGDGAAEFLNRCLSNDLGRIGPGQAQYTLACDAATGGVVDDLIVYYRDDDHLLLVPNAANSAEVKRRLEAERPGRGHDHRPPRDPRRAGRAGHAVRRGARRRSGCPTGHDYMSFEEAPFEDARRSWCAAPATPASAATS